ncbi:MAG: enoyl-CoA hydratase [bacterium]|nr:enoyl-CoA hydratase [Deltaproteobacteria bacterium]MCP4904652.1 enoyl-CoA hydratase [bacterium]
MSTILTKQIEEGVALVTLNRPERRNALAMDLVIELTEEMKRLRHDRDTRVVVLNGAGQGFCAGADLVQDGDRPPGAEGMTELGFIYRMQEHIAEMMIAVHELPKPVIAAVHGAAVGGGLALALASDMRVAADTAKFGSVFIKVGLSSCDVGTSYFLPRLVGPGRAFELMTTGRHFDASEAFEMGLVQSVVAEGKEIEKALETARLIVQNNEYGVWMTKSGMWTNLDAPSLRHAMELENRTQVLGTFTGNMTEAMQAFREKRDPRWKPL